MLSLANGLKRNACLSFYAFQSAFWQVFFRVGNSSAPFFGRVFELNVATFRGDLEPSIFFQRFDNLSAVHFSSPYALIMRKYCAKVKKKMRKKYAFLSDALCSMD